MARVIFNGKPGETWTNDTGRVRYQLLVNWANTCGVCAQYDHAIGPAWPLPYHRNCRCRQVAIVPGADAEPFVDFLAIARGLDEEGLRALVGASNFRLVESGVVRWEDVVTPYRVRSLHEVVAVKKLPVDRLVAAGVRRDRAEKAWETVHTPEHQLVEAQRRKLVAALEGAGLDRGTLAGLAGEALATRAGIGSGPSGPGSFSGGSAEERLKRYLAAWTPTAPKPAPKRPRKPAAPKEAPGPAELFAPEASDTVAAADVRAAREAIEKVPAAIRAELRRRDFRLRLVARVGELVGYKLPDGRRIPAEYVDRGIRGWSAKATLANCPGWFTLGFKLSVVQTRYKSLATGRVRVLDSTAAVALHETGHAIDAAYNYVCRAKAFAEAHAADAAALSAEDRRRLSYFLLPGDGGASEVFAELTAEAYGPRGDQDRRVREAFPTFAKLHAEWFADPKRREELDR